jgi:hypothetical protein
MDNKKRKRKDSIMFYKCDLCNHVTTSRASLTVHTRSLKHLINYEKHKNYEHDIVHYNGLLLNEKLDDFEISDEMLNSMKDFDIKTFSFYS